MDLKDVKIQSIEEIVKAHDILDAMLEGDIPFEFESGKKTAKDESIKGMIIARYVLCWILKHERGKWFEERIVELKAELFAKGFTDVDF